ncbi:MAG: sigma-70 family RNA polymerase sigma factor [Vicinamibacterales bacterium]
MEHMRTLGLLDSNGNPLAERIQRAVAGLLPKLRRQFPTLRDDVAVAEVIEEAGRRIASREERGGPIEQLHAYAWVTIRSVATSHLRKPANRLIRDTVGSKAAEIHLASIPASHGSAEQIERDLLIREAMEALSEDERVVCMWKAAGYSAQEIAAFQGLSVVNVDTLFSRAKQKLRQALGQRPGDTNRATLAPVNDHALEPQSGGEDQTETRDGQHSSVRRPR